MSSPGDSLLVRAGLVRPEQLVEARTLQRRDGGTLGECLVRLGYVTEEQLVEFFHRRLLVPRVTAEQLASLSPEVLAAVPADMAAEFRVIPVGIDEDAQQTITLAMADPSDTHIVEEVSFFADRFCQRAVAPESAIRDAVERHYGVRFRSPRASDRLAGLSTRNDSRRDASRPAMAQREASEVVLLTHKKTEPAKAAPLEPMSAPEVAPSVVAVPAQTLLSLPPPAHSFVDDAAPAVAESPPAEPSPRTVAPPEDTPPSMVIELRSAIPATTMNPEVPPELPAVAPIAELPAAPESSPPTDAPSAPTAESPSAEVLVDEPRGAPTEIPLDDVRRPKVITQVRGAFARVPRASPTEAEADEAPIPLTRPIAAAVSRGGTIPGMPVANLTPEVPVEKLRVAESRESIATVLVEYGTELGLRAMLFVMRKGALAGYDARGTVSLETLKQTPLPVDSPSLLRDVIQSRLPYQGAETPRAVHPLLESLIVALPGETLLMPIAVGDKVIAVLYADGLMAPLPPASLTQLANEAGQAYERLIRAARR